MLRLIRRAGLPAWPKPFRALRAGLETDLMADHPIHFVCAWLGNTPGVVLKHYIQVRDTDYDLALAGRGGAESGTKAGAGWGGLE